MAYLCIHFLPCPSFSTLREALEKLEFFRIVGDWHDYRLQSLENLGIKSESAPAKTLIEDRNKNGRSFLVRVVLGDGSEVTGQLRQTSLLISNAIGNSPISVVDENVKQLLSCVERSAIVKLTESGA
jgi:hypothetical protein